MLHRRILLIIGSLAVVISVSCSKSETQQNAERAESIAVAFFSRLSVPEPETKALWGMSDFHVFGRDKYAGWIAAGGAETAKLNDSSNDKFEVIIPFWCQGTDLKGNEVKLSKRLCVKINLKGTQNYKINYKFNNGIFGQEYDGEELSLTSLDGDGIIQNYEFRDDQELTLFRQLLSCVGWSLVAPIAALIMVMFAIPILSDIMGQIFDSKYAGLGLLLSLVIAIPVTILIVADVAYTCFGSVVASIIYTVIFTVLATWLTLSFIAASRTVNRRY